MDIMKESLDLHRKLNGKISVESKIKLKDMHDMSLAYTPGVAQACLAIKENPAESFNLTSRNNMVAVISDGTAVLGLGDIGPLAAMPVMEGKAAIFKEFAGVNAIPIVLNTTDTEEIIQTIANIAPSFGGINLEDISAPKCFEVERRLKEILDIPVFHDDQHGTAIVAGAALLNALRLVKKDLEKVNIVINGAGSAGIAITNFLLALGAKNITVVDRFGILVSGDSNLNSAQEDIAKLTNKTKKVGTLIDALNGADVLIGVSAANVVSAEMIKVMSNDPIVFALANPIPEIPRDVALAAGARVVGTGVSNLPNQINNALVFPGLFKGALEAKVKQITIEMEVACCHALANVVTSEELNENYIIPGIFHPEVVKSVSNAIINLNK